MRTFFVFGEGYLAGAVFMALTITLLIIWGTAKETQGLGLRAS